MAFDAPTLPKVALTRAQWLRLVFVGAFALIAIGRVLPDGVRALYPLHYFDYVTDGDGIVVRADAKPHKGDDRIALGDRVRVDRIKPFDRKPGLAGASYSYDNPDRRLPVEHRGHVRTIHLVGRTEPLPSRVTVILRILLCLIVVGLGAILYLIKPGIPTAAIFFYCIGGTFPTTYAELSIPYPWRIGPEWIGMTLDGASDAALFLFALCVLVDDERRERAFAVGAGLLGIALGTLYAYADWALTYGARPAQRFDDLYARLSDVIVGLTIVVFVLAFVRSHAEHRRRIGWMIVAFAFAGAARLASDTFYPAHIGPWENGLLLTLTPLPIVAVWVAVLRHRFFNVDFVVSRAVVYVAITAGIIGGFTLVEEVGTYNFYMNTDFAYGFLIVFSMAVGAATNRIRPFVEHIVDRFIFRNRHSQREALEIIGGYILDAEHVEDVYRALLEDATHALGLSFAGVLTRRDDGSYALGQNYEWPADCVVRLERGDELIVHINRSRGALTFSGKESRLIRKAFPNERLTFAAPLFFDRSVSAIVVYGHSVSGLDLDPEERDQLVRVVAHASIALHQIELARYRAAAASHEGAAVGAP
jgi:hypothetical protein